METPNDSPANQANVIQGLTQDDLATIHRELNENKDVSCNVIDNYMTLFVRLSGLIFDVVILTQIIQFLFIRHLNLRKSVRLNISHRELSRVFLNIVANCKTLFSRRSDLGYTRILIRRHRNLIKGSLILYNSLVTTLTRYLNVVQALYDVTITI
jgi:hypothetical protein